MVRWINYENISGKVNDIEITKTPSNILIRTMESRYLEIRALNSPLSPPTELNQ